MSEPAIGARTESTAGAGAGPQQASEARGASVTVNLKPGEEPTVTAGNTNGETGVAPEAGEPTVEQGDVDAEKNRDAAKDLAATRDQDGDHAAMEEAAKLDTGTKTPEEDNPNAADGTTDEKRDDGTPVDGAKQTDTEGDGKGDEGGADNNEGANQGGTDQETDGNNDNNGDGNQPAEGDAPSEEGNQPREKSREQRIEDYKQMRLSNNPDVLKRARTMLENGDDIAVAADAELKQSGEEIRRRIGQPDTEAKAQDDLQKTIDEYKQLSTRGLLDKQGDPNLTSEQRQVLDILSEGHEDYGKILTAGFDDNQLRTAISRSEGNPDAAKRNGLMKTELDRRTQAKAESQAGTTPAEKSATATEGPKTEQGTTPEQEARQKERKTLLEIADRISKLGFSDAQKDVIFDLISRDPQATITALEDATKGAETPEQLQKQLAEKQAELGEQAAKEEEQTPDKEPERMTGGVISSEDMAKALANPDAELADKLGNMTIKDMAKMLDKIKGPVKKGLFILAILMMIIGGAIALGSLRLATKTIPGSGKK